MPFPKCPCHNSLPLANSLLSHPLTHLRAFSKMKPLLLVIWELLQEYGSPIEESLHSSQWEESRSAKVSWQRVSLDFDQKNG